MKLLKVFFWTIISLLLVLAVALSKYLYFPKQHQILENTYENWSAPIVKHILPSFDHEQLLVKISTKEPQLGGLTLKVNSQVISACQDNVKDQYFCFYTDDLTPNTVYKLELFNADNRSISDHWSIKTYPHPDSTVDEMTIMAYTCAGGIDGHFFGQEVFNNVRARQALLKRGLEYNPDVIIANGDHIYWDQKSFKITRLKKLLSLRRDRKFGQLNLQKPMLGIENIDVFTHMADAQIAEVYGAYLREHNVLFVSDDHDLLENDEALPNLITLPPKDYMLDASRSTQALYYPEFLSNRLKPDLMDRILNNSNEQLDLYTSFGILQFGDLLEIDLYDSKKYCSLNGEDAIMIPLEVEEWLTERTMDTTIKWLFHAPSSPFGWTAGKWHEWYPDVLDENDLLTIEKEKYKWQKGWWKQHQRLMTAMNHKNPSATILQGDLHMAGVGKIVKSGDLSFSENPIYAIGTGPLGSGKLGFPSSVRNSGSAVPKMMEVEELMPPVEKNGFTIIKVKPDSILVQIFLWRSPQPIEEIETMKPSFEFNIVR